MQPGAPQKVLGPAMALAVVGILACALPPLEADPPAKAPAPGTLFLYPERIDLGEEGFVRADRGMLFVPARRSRRCRKRRRRNRRGCGHRHTLDRINGPGA